MRALRSLPKMVLIPLLLTGCGGESGSGGEARAVPAARPKGDLNFAFVDVASQVGYTLRNHTGKEYRKEYILEAMPPGIAVADFDGNGWMDLYCANGNDIISYNPKTQVATILGPDVAVRNELYLNKGGKFEAAGKARGVDDHLWGYGAIAGDVDNDGDPDIYLANWGLNRLYINDGKGHFTDVAARAGVAGDPRDWSTGSCFIDYDKDGDLDIYVAQYSDVYEMLRRPDVTTVLPDGSITGRNCEWKKLKVYCGPLGLRPINDLFFKNLLVETGKLQFKDVTREAGLWFKYDERRSATESSPGPFYGFQPISWDVNGDGWPDIFVANDSVENTCFINHGDGTFTNEAPRLSLALSMDDYNPQASMGVNMGDINGDGLFDLVVAEFSHDQFNLLIAERFQSGLVGFNEMAAKTRMREFTFAKLAWGTLLFDPDLDGDLDIFWACGHVYPEVDTFPNQDTTYRQLNLLIENQDPSRLKLRNISAMAGPGLQIEKASRAAVAVDFDNDGDQDIAITELNDTPSLLRLDVDHSKGVRHWIQIRPFGDPGKKVPLDPVGAIVRVTAGGSTQSRVFVLGSSFMSNEDPRIHFGLGSHDTVDLIEVAWPNGTTTRLENVKADQRIRIKLGQLP